MISKECFNNTMNALLNVYDKELPKKEAHEIYFLIFNKNFESDEELQAATLKVIETRVFPSFPKPAEFLEAGKNKVDIEEKALKAVYEVKAAIKKYGAYSNVCFEDPIIHACIKDLFGGWVKTCTLDIEEFEKAMKWDFQKLYKYYTNNKIKNIPVYLTGIASNNNENNGIKEGFQIEYVGDVEKCKKWTALYFSKNIGELQNQKKYVQLGYKQEEILQIEHSESPIKSVNEMIQDLTEEFGLNKEVKKTLTGVELTQEQLLKQYKSAYPNADKIEKKEE